MSAGLPQRDTWKICNNLPAALVPSVKLAAAGSGSEVEGGRGANKTTNEASRIIGANRHWVGWLVSSWHNVARRKVSERHFVVVLVLLNGGDWFVAKANGRQTVGTTAASISVASRPHIDAFCLMEASRLYSEKRLDRSQP